MEYHKGNARQRNASHSEDSELRLMNELDNYMHCPRCKKAVPVFIRIIESWDRFGKDYRKEVHCLKCFFSGHKEGTFIREFAGF